MPNYTFTIVLMDSGLPYPDLKSAKKDAEEWATEIAQSENCLVASVKVEEDES
jgi:hypothetical protein